jgi:hypothetical protein
VEQALIVRSALNGVKDGHESRALRRRSRKPVEPTAIEISVFGRLWNYLFTATPNISKCAPRSNGPEPTKARAGYSLPK